MEKLERITFEEQAPDLKDRVEGYWSKRAASFYELKRAEAESVHARRWQDVLEELLPEAGERGSLKILDVGCGAGFFEVILGRMGHEICGIDLTPEMIVCARDMIRGFDLDPERVQARVMDAENPEFPEETFDVIITRNVTWNLPHPDQAYRQWHRVLKKGGVLLNFDAEYAKGAHDPNHEDNDMAHRGVDDAMKAECHAIYHLLSISTLDRPLWDRQILEELGFRDIVIDSDFGSRIYQEKDPFYVPDPMFRIRAVKN